MIFSSKERNFRSSVSKFKKYGLAMVNNVNVRKCQHKFFDKTSTGLRFLNLRNF